MGQKGDTDLNVLGQDQKERSHTSISIVRIDIKTSIKRREDLILKVMIVMLLIQKERKKRKLKNK